MKRLFGWFVLLCLLASIFTACSEEPAETVVTYDQNTTAPTSQTPETTQPEEIESSSAEDETETTEPQTAPRAPYELVYSSAVTQRDSVGNIWLNVMIAFENTGEEAIRLDYSNIVVYADDEELVVLEDAVCYPQMIESGQVGYYFEQRQVDLDENAELRAETYPNVERANQMTKYVVEDIQLRDSAYGVEVYGMYQADEEASGLLCVAVILFDLDGNPFAVLSDYIDASTKEFVLSSDKLPEGLSSTDISSYIAYVYPYEG